MPFKIKIMEEIDVGLASNACVDYERTNSDLVSSKPNR